MNTICSYTMSLATLFSKIVIFLFLVESKVLEQIATSRPHDKLSTEAYNVRTWRSSCSEAQIQVSQGLESSTGIPRYTVMIVNMCDNDCWVARVHLHCGWFASANVVNPNLFKRLTYDDCIVNAGKPIPNGHVIEFQYSNTNNYALSVASYVCWP